VTGDGAAPRPHHHRHVHHRDHLLDPGIGRYFINSVFNRDFSVVMGITVLTSLIIIIANLFVDIMYGILDPRTRDVR
jgi:ABC-type antimicrobial peptide transport system permease subunit